MRTTGGQGSQRMSLKSWILVEINSSHWRRWENEIKNGQVNQERLFAVLDVSRGQW